jgi:uncharacterized membrane protein HdeD (DUF308 family)
MLFYPGGTLVDEYTSGYLFFSNFFSDLGRIMSLSGEVNTISYSIFTITALFMGVAFLLYNVLMICFFQASIDDNKITLKIVYLGAFFGILSALFLLGTVLTPWDVYEEGHLYFANLFNILGIFASIFYIIGIFRHKNYPNKYGYLYIILLGLAFIYSIILISIPKELNAETLLFQASTQKVTQYWFLFCFTSQAYSLYKLNNSERFNY